MSEPIIIRQLSARDSIGALTRLVQAAYATLGHRGWNFNGVDQTDDLTCQRVRLGISLVAEMSEALVGTITVHGSFSNAPCEYITQADVAYFQQFAVDPGHQRLGIGNKLLEQAEACARAAGYAWLSTDTAQGALDLLSFYSRRGYSAVTSMQWPGKTYRSVVLSKSL